MQVKYLSQSDNGIYNYRRRIPNELQTILNKSEIKVSLGRDLTSAISKSNLLTQSIQQSLQVFQMQTLQNDKSEMIIKLLEPFGFKIESKKVLQPFWKSICAEYLNAQDVSADELRDRRYFLDQVAPTIFKLLLKTSNPELNIITFKNILDFQNIIGRLPKRNIQKYRDIELSVLIPNIVQNKCAVAEKELLSTRTKNKYIKWLKAIFAFADVRDLISKNVTKSIILKNTTKQRDEREALSQVELQILFSVIPNDDLAYLLKILQLTGMRRSELYKCSLKHYDGVICFDLSGSHIALKTASSYRIIPVHSKLLSRVDEFENIRQKFSGTYLSRYFSNLIKKNLQEPENKSLYSLRHSMATELIAKNVAPEIVSELMGHVHQSITMSRYVKGYPVETLLEAIEKLK